MHKLPFMRGAGWDALQARWCHCEQPGQLLRHLFPLWCRGNLSSRWRAGATQALLLLLPLLLLLLLLRSQAATAAHGAHSRPPRTGPRRDAGTSRARER